MVHNSIKTYNVSVYNSGSKTKRLRHVTQNHAAAVANTETGIDKRQITTNHGKRRVSHHLTSPILRGICPRKTGQAHERKILVHDQVRGCLVNTLGQDAWLHHTEEQARKTTLWLHHTTRALATKTPANEGEERAVTTSTADPIPPKQPPGKQPSSRKTGGRAVAMSKLGPT